MSTYIIVKDELSHYGVKGMKWGVRKDPRLVEARKAYRNANREHNRAFNKASRFSERHPITQYIRKSKNYNKSNELWRESQKKAKQAVDAKDNLKNVKKTIKSEKQANIKAKSDKYSKAYDKASASQDKADAKWQEAKSAHKSLGKTAISRAMEVVKAQKGQGSAAAKNYLKKYGEWEALQEKADSATKEMRKSRESLGSNWVSRTFRTIKYR